MYQDFTTTENPKHISNLTFKIYNDSKCECMRINTSVSTLTDLETILIYFEIRAKSDEKSKEYDRLLLKGELDLCKVSKGIVGGFIAQFMVDRVIKYSNAQTLSCPINKQFLFVREAPLLREKDLPTFLIPLRGKFHVFAMYKGKVYRKRSSVWLLSIHVYGEHI